MRWSRTNESKKMFYCSLRIGNLCIVHQYSGPVLTVLQEKIALPFYRNVDAIVNGENEG